MGIISIGVGTAHMGRKQVDKDGNVVKETPARWEVDPEGGSVDTRGFLIEPLRAINLAR